MFHNVGAFCCQLLNAILLLYDLIFSKGITDPVVLLMRVFWMFGALFGLSVTATGGIMVNHYVSTKFKMLCFVLVVAYVVFWAITQFRVTHCAAILLNIVIVVTIVVTILESLREFKSPAIIFYCCLSVKSNKI